MSAVDLDAVAELLPAHLGRQRWFSGGDPEKVSIEEDETLDHRLTWMLVDADGARYQLLVGAADAGAVPEFLHGHDDGILGFASGHVLFDGLLDPDLAHIVLGVVAPGESAQRVRPMGAEQSNTSLVFDDRLVLKVFRRVHDGANPDIEVTDRLGRAGFDHVAAPVAVWRRDGRDLAVVQPYLAGATDGWALALTSLRDLYASDCDDPAQCGGDFAGEATRLGQVTAAMHVALAETFGTEDADAREWVDAMERQLGRVAAREPWRRDAASVLRRLADLAGGAGRALRVHGDYHLGQVVRTDAGWYVLDFEGEPARPLEERQLPSSALKDVSGMLRSFHYAQAVAIRERGEEDVERCIPLGLAWETRNRAAFLEGYLGTEGVGTLLPPDLDGALAAWELDKAVYEVGYERGHRPDWVEIPAGAVRRIVAAAASGGGANKAVDG